MSCSLRVTYRVALGESAVDNPWLVVPTLTPALLVTRDTVGESITADVHVASDAPGVASVVECFET